MINIFHLTKAKRMKKTKEKAKQGNGKLRMVEKKEKKG